MRYICSHQSKGLWLLFLEADLFLPFSVVLGGLSLFLRISHCDSELLIMDLGYILWLENPQSRVEGSRRNAYLINLFHSQNENFCKKDPKEVLIYLKNIYTLCQTCHQHKGIQKVIIGLDQSQNSPFLHINFTNLYQLLVNKEERKIIIDLSTSSPSTTFQQNLAKSRLKLDNFN